MKSKEQKMSFRQQMDVIKSLLSAGLAYVSEEVSLDKRIPTVYSLMILKEHADKADNYVAWDYFDSDVIGEAQYELMKEGWK